MTSPPCLCLYPHPQTASPQRSDPTSPAVALFCSTVQSQGQGLLGCLCCVPWRSLGGRKERQVRSPRLQHAASGWGKWDRNTSKARGKSQSLAQVNSCVTATHTHAGVAAIAKKQYGLGHHSIPHSQFPCICCSLS